MSAVDNAKKYLSLRPPMENKTIFALHPDVLVEGLLDEIERLRKQNAVLETELALVRSMLPNVKAYQTGTGDFTPLEEKE